MDTDNLFQTPDYNARIRYAELARIEDAARMGAADMDENDSWKDPSAE